MLRELNIENVAVIEKAQVIFSEGLNVLTGETGAGKSILIDSINAILGNRTTREIVRSGASKAVIWAEFRDINPLFIGDITRLGYECDGTLILHREITADGKSVCRINGRPATAQNVRDVCGNLINIHGQHDNQDLLNPERHLGIIDDFASLGETADRMSKLYDELSAVKGEIDRLSADEAKRESTIDLLNYQIDEIEKSELYVGEDEELAARRALVRNSERLTQALGEACAVLSGDSETDGALSMLYTAVSKLEGIAGLDESVDACASRLSEMYYGINDIASEIGGIAEGFGFDARDIDAVEERMDLIYKLKRKYGETVEDILKFCEDAKRELEGIEKSDERLSELNARYDRLRSEAIALAEDLSEKRRAAFPVFSGKITDELAYLNMQGVSFKIAHRRGALSRRGLDVVEFFISPNVGEEPKPLSKIASGGELSRIMLAIKNTMADKDRVDTLIFDEIDTGVSGEAAAKIGKKLKQSARSRQTICVTHSAQIAAFSDNHLFIEKKVRDARTYTEITTLDPEQRKHELARIISGDNVTETALKNAEEMLERAKRD